MPSMLPRTGAAVAVISRSGLPIGQAAPAAASSPYIDRVRTPRSTLVVLLLLATAPVAAATGRAGAAPSAPSAPSAPGAPAAPGARSGQDASASAPDLSLNALVDPFIGSAGSPPWFSGNTTPAAARPFGMLQLGPDTTSDVVAGQPSATASGYSADDDRIRGFSPLHLSGVGCSVFGDVPVLPVVGGLPANPDSATVKFDHDDEAAGPGWYRVRLANDVSVSLAAGDRTGLATFRFPTGPRARLLIKADGSLAGARHGRVDFPHPREIAVTATSGGFCGSPGSYRVHVLLRFDRPVERRGTWGAAPRRDGSVAGDDVGGWVSFGTRKRPMVRAQIGVSFVDAAGARANLEKEQPRWSFTRLRDEGSLVWARELSRVRTTGGTLVEQVVFRSALYRVLLNPMTVSDSDGRYPGFDGVVHRLPQGQRQYSALPGWDAYRTHMPLLAWLRPDVASEVVRSLQRAGQQAGWLPRWPLVASYTGVMNGDSAGPMVASAHAFGARDFGLSTVVSQLVEQAEQTDGLPGQGWFQPRPGLADYLRLGYVTNTEPERGWPQPHGASTTIEYAVDDFAVSRLAEAAGRTSDAERLGRRSDSWRNLLDETRGLLLPRDAEGAFPGPEFDPGSCCDGFQEGNAAQYTWGVPQDMAGLLTGLGPRDEVLSRLIDFHTRLNSGAGTAHAWFGNQPSLATPWAYLWLGEPLRAQDVVSRVRDELWRDTPDGIPGNDDLGSLSAWYVWASLGLYPLTPGTANLGVTTPVFSDVTVRPSAGVSTRIVRTGSGAHVQGLLVDGTARSSSWLDLGPDQRPSRLDVITTDGASAWGTGPGDVPPSYPSP